MLQKQPIIKTFGYLFIILSAFLIAFSAEAKTKIHLYPDTQARGYTFTSKDGKFKIGIQPEGLLRRKVVILTVKTVKKENYVMPEDHNLISKIYSYRFSSQKKTQVVKPLWLSINYNIDSGAGKSIKYWRADTKKWRNLASDDNEENKNIRTSIFRRKAIVAVFQEKLEGYEIGLASWYDSDGAAHRTYPFGTIVKVTNLANNKSCEVAINDRGPFIEGRIIDLPREAFAEIADLGAGIVEVKVEPIYIP